MNFTVNMAGIRGEDTVARLVCAGEPVIVSYTRMERGEACPVCQAVDGMTIAADDTETYNNYELLHYGCLGFWYANYSNDPGADIIDWKTPPENLRAKYMNPLKSGVTVPVTEAREGMTAWYSEHGQAMPEGFEKWTPKQVRAHHRELIKVSPEYATRARMTKVNASYLSADRQIVDATENALGAGLRSDKEIRAALKAQGFDEYRINKYLSSSIGKGNVELYGQLDILGKTPVATTGIKQRAASKTVTSYSKGVSPGQKLSALEKESVMRYTRSGYYDINENLRAGTIDKVLKKKLVPLDSALSKLPAYEGKVYRGMQFLDTKELNAFMGNVTKGNSISFPSYTSTSPASKIASEFAGLGKKTASNKVLLTMESKTGRIVGGISDLAGESEVLFLRDSTFEITDKIFNKKTKIWEIFLKEI